MTEDVGAGEVQGVEEEVEGVAGATAIGKVEGSGYDCLGYAQA